MQSAAKGCRRVTAHVRRISATCTKSAMRKNGFLLTIAWSLLLLACGSGAVPGSLFGRPVGLGVGTAADGAARGLVPRGLMLSEAHFRAVRSVARCSA
jgi:hypothetical protein